VSYFSTILAILLLFPVQINTNRTIFLQSLFLQIYICSSLFSVLYCIAKDKKNNFVKFSWNKNGNVLY
jgi:hypothetical protein